MYTRNTSFSSEVYMDINGILIQLGGFFDWLFGTRTGVLCLIGRGIVLFLIIALILERRTKKMYFNHEKSPDDFSLFGDDDEEEQS